MARYEQNRGESSRRSGEAQNREKAWTEQAPYILQPCARSRRRLQPLQPSLETGHEVLGNRRDWDGELMLEEAIVHALDNGASSVSP